MSNPSFGLVPALVTPFDEGNNVDYDRLAAHASWCLDAGCSKISLFGTTGEGPSLSSVERERIFDTLAQAQVSPDKWVVAVFATSAGEAVAQISSTYKHGVRTMLLAPPFYYPEPDEEAVYQWFVSVIEQAGREDLRFLLYNIPSMTRVSMSPELANRLYDRFGRVIQGVKDSSVDWPKSKAFLQSCPELEILIGDERDLAKGVPLGLAGAISGCANLAPSRLLDVLSSGQEDESLNALVDAIVALPVTPAVKYAMEIKHGGNWRRVRPPLSDVPDQPDSFIELVASF